MAGKKKKLSKKQKATQAAAAPRDQYSTIITASTDAPANSNKSSAPTKKEKNLQELARILAEWEAEIASSKAKAGTDPATIAGAAGGLIATQERGVRQPTTATSKMNPGSQTPIRGSPSVKQDRAQCRKGYIGEAITGVGNFSAPQVLAKHNPVKEKATKQSRIVITADRATTQDAVKVKGTRHILIPPDTAAKQNPVKEKGMKQPGILISPNKSAKPKAVQEKATKPSGIPITDHGAKQNPDKQKATTQSDKLVSPNKSAEPNPVKVKGTKQPGISVTPEKEAKQNPVAEKGTKLSGTLISSDKAAKHTPVKERGTNTSSGALIPPDKVAKRDTANPPASKKQKTAKQIAGATSQKSGPLTQAGPAQDAEVKPRDHSLGQIPSTKSSVLTIGPKTVHCTPPSEVGAAPLAGGSDQFAESTVHNLHPDQGEKIYAPLGRKKITSLKQLSPLVQHVVADQLIIGHQHRQTLGCTAQTPMTTSGSPPSSSARGHGTQLAQIVETLRKKNKAFRKQMPPLTHSPQVGHSATGTHVPELRDGRTQALLKLLQPSIVEQAIKEARQTMGDISPPAIPTALVPELAKAITKPTPGVNKLELVPPSNRDLAPPACSKRRKKGDTASRFATQVLLAVIRGGVPLLFTDLVSLLPL